MERSRICLTVTGNTIEENVSLVNLYRKYIDIVELRVDYLEEEERLHIRDFPALVNIPCILTIRRQVDGGKFREGESERTILFAQALAFADPDPRKNFAYVDFEEDYHVPSLQDASLAFGTRIIRSVHDMENPVSHIMDRIKSLRTTGFEIPKIAFMPRSLSDVTDLFQEMAHYSEGDHIVCAMGPLGLPTRILAGKLHSFLTYTSPAENLEHTKSIGHLDPVTIEETYHFRSLTDTTDIYGITGFPLTATSSPAIHNAGYKEKNINAVYIPVRAESISEAIDFADTVGMKGLSVTIPHKEAVVKKLSEADDLVKEIGACNTILKRNSGWAGYNTDAPGFTRALLEFTGTKSLRGKHIAIIGAGGAAKAVAYAVYKLKGKACVFNRTFLKAKQLADQFGFKYAPLGPEQTGLIKKYSDVIIQTTSKGMGSLDRPDESNDPLFFYDFTGRELLFDIIYVPEKTPVMIHAEASGCRTSNGYNMLRYQGFEQFELFTGESYESDKR